MQRELELLQRWKADAVGILQQMQTDVSTAQAPERLYRVSLNILYVLYM